MAMISVNNRRPKMTLLLAIILWLCFQSQQILSYEVIEKCEEGCDKVVNSEKNVFDIACNGSCKLQQCRFGCQRWTEAQPTCTQACNDSSTVNNWVLYCLMGCNHALSVYIDKIIEEVDTPSAPFLVADSLTNESLAIEWKTTSYANITYLVQWKYELLAGQWNYYKPDQPINASRVEIKGLEAYTQYRFRVEWIVLRQYEMPLFSHQSVIISTLPYGVPSSPPAITSLIAISASQVSVSWEAPRFPNGPIISYALYLNEYPKGQTLVKDILNSHTRSASDSQLRHNKSLHYMFNGLKANTTYHISVVARNNFGEGPKALSNVTTLEADNRNSSEDETSLPQLIVATDKEVIRRDPAFPIEEEVIFRLNDYTINADISGLAVHVEYKYLFVSDTSGTVRRISLKDDNNKQMRTIVRDRSRKPSHLSVDWLGDRVYMIEETKISRCNLDGDYMESVITGFKTRPVDMKVDPYNGYLYWLSISDTNTASLYRTDLALIARDVITHSYANLIFQESSVTTFAVDFINYRIYVPISREASIFSITIDGNDKTNIRHNSQRNDQLEDIHNLVVHNSFFYFTKDNEVFREEYESQSDKYYHNSAQVEASALVSLCVLDHKSQPYPVPLNPVKSVQAVFLDRSAKIVWEKPDLLGDKGQGAWQQWAYEVSIEETLSRITFVDRGLTTTYCEADELNPNTEYNIRVRAYSKEGNGSWSETFHGKTLHSIQRHSRFPFALWSTREGVLKSNIVGDRVEHLVHRMNMNGTVVNDITWYRDVIYLNGENNIFIYNLTSHASLTRIANITSAFSIAIDWLAPKLYWSSPAQRMISRSNLDGSQSEPLPIMTFAKELAIDSAKGYIYWTTGYSVEFCRLNGMDRMKYFETNLFSGKHIMGLTLSLDQNLVFWILRSYDGVVLYSAQLANGDNAVDVSATIKTVGQLSESNIRGPLAYYSDRMFWLEEEQNHALISEVNGENFAVLKGLGLNDINTLAIVDPSLHPIPNGFDALNEIQVIPNDLKEEDIKLTGNWDNFTIFWKKCENVNYGEVFYDLIIEDSHVKHSMTTHKTKYPYPLVNQLAPYSKIKLAIRAFTYWASSKQTVIELYSPMSIPTKPSKPRIFIDFERSTYDNSIEKIHAEFRWSPPELPNGVILGYTVNAWSIQSGHKNIEVENEKIYGHLNQIYLSDLKINTTYYFQVQAFTEAGDGPPSDIIGVNSSEEHPVPRLLVTKTDSIRMADIDSFEEKILTSKSIIPVSVTYISKENLMFWVEEDGILKKSYLDGSNITIIHQMFSPGTGLTVDWISRHLYWTESDISSPKSTIWSYDLNDPNAKPILVTSKNNVIIGALEVDPFSSTLIWTEMFNKNQGQMKMCSTNAVKPSSTANVRLFFQQNKVRNRRDLSDIGCNCAAHPVVSSSLAIDRSNYGKSELLWFDSKYERIIASDMSGCICRVLINNTYGFPPDSMTVDNDYIYWSNSTLGNVYKISKQRSNSKSEELSSLKSLPNKINPLKGAKEPHLVLSETANGVHGIKALSDHLQPYPNFECLVPMEYHETVKLLDNTAKSLTITMQEVRRPLGCAKTSLASVQYTIFYGKVLSDGFYECGLSLRGCKIIETFNDTITITGLEPFTNYTIRVAVKNYYTPNNSINLPGPPVNFETAESRPSPPRNVVAKVETPHKIMVMWEPPEKPNGDPILYELRWYSSKDQNWHKAIYTRKPNITRFGDKFYMRMTDNIRPGLTYFISVRAYSGDGLQYSDSAMVSVSTYGLPNDIVLEDKASRLLRVSWISPNSDQNVSEIGQHTIQYSRFGTQRWIGQEFNRTQPSTKYIFSIKNLIPNTEYSFRLLLTYRSTTSLFEWPENERYVYKTLGDAPEAPNKPQVMDIPGVSQPLYKVWWNKVNPNGAQSLWYHLMFKLMDKTSDESSGRNEWVVIYNGSENYWFVDSLSSDKSYTFKVGAISEFGASNYSDESQEFEYRPMTPMLPNDDTDIIAIFAAILGAFLFVFVILTLFFTIRRRQVQEQKEKALEDDRIHRNSDLELVPWSEYPGHPHHLNALYTNSFDWNSELIGITKIKKEQISETKFLGSGAFGEVFEGLWHQFDGNGQKISKVAIKILRKGASDEQKSNFLKEAKTMANFKHPNILKLQCVCLDPTFVSLVLELMVGGDLRMYLVNNRPKVSIASPLTMDDLIDICIDVVKGCEYLEERQHVHRDLAARNCLVSSFDRKSRVVKIGDFGLARDIYKNDYYRKEGEGLLPVRWMAPEALIDGVFTSQSDVWSFGVILYEVMTLGEQPYLARSNTEVLSYVRTGRILERPVNCPEEMYQLMKRCWTFQREDRPNFSECLQALEDMKKTITDFPVITTVHNQNYIFNRGFENPGYSEDERAQAGNSCHSLKTSSPCAQISSANSTALKPNYQNGHLKYLELIGATVDDCGLTDADGYQIPISKSPLQASGDKNLLKTMNQIVLNSNDSARREQPIATARRKQLVDSTRGCSPPPTYSQVFKVPEVGPNSDLNICEMGTNGQSGERQTSSQYSLTLSQEKTKNCLLVIKDNKHESIHKTNPLIHSSSLSSSPISCSTSSSSSPIIAAALLKCQSPLSQLSQPSRHLNETKYCFNGNEIHSKSVTNSSIDGSEEEYDTDFDTQTIAANDLFLDIRCGNDNHNKQSPKTSNPNLIGTGFANPLISEQNQNKYTLITRLDGKSSFPVNNINHSYNFDTNSSWC